MCVFSTFALELEDKQGRERWKGRSLILLHMPSENCNNAHVTELLCVIIGNFRFSNCYHTKSLYSLISYQMTHEVHTEYISVKNKTEHGFLCL